MKLVRLIPFSLVAFVFLVFHRVSLKLSLFSVNVQTNQHVTKHPQIKNQYQNLTPLR